MKPPSRRPVFLDSTGRRRRTIRRVGAFLAVPTVGYLALMASSLAGGPRMDTPLIPLPEAAKPKHRPTEPVEAAVQTPLPTPAGGSTEPGDGSSSTSATDSPSSTTGTAGATTAPATTAPTTGPVTPGVSPTIVPPATPGRPTLTVVPTTAPTSTTTTTAPPTTTTTTHGNKPTTPPPGQTKTPGKP